MARVSAPAKAAEVGDLPDPYFPPEDGAAREGGGTAVERRRGVRVAGRGYCALTRRGGKF